MNIEELYLKLKRDAEGSGYNLNPDAEFAKELAKGLLENEARYGYQACPCRLASGKKQEDLDIICPAITGMPTLKNTTPAIARYMFPLKFHPDKKIGPHPREKAPPVKEYSGKKPQPLR